MGLDNSVQNLMLVCLKCHREIHQHEDYAALNGHIVHADPARTPLRVARERWALLDGAGGYHALTPVEAISLIRAAEESRGNPLAGIA